MGKTEWARSLGSHMYFNNLFNLTDWNSDADYLILDDIDFEWIPNKKGWFGAQKSFVLTDKYKGKRTVAWGKPLIYLTNDYPFTKVSNSDLDWYNANCKIVYLQNKLY